MTGIRFVIPANCLAARVTQASREHYHVHTGDTEMVVRVAGTFRHSAKTPSDFPVVGDWVIVQSGLILDVVPRRTKFSRLAAGERAEEQVIAANIDTVFLVCGLDGDFNVRRLERYLVLAHESGAAPVVVLNKSDLCPASLADRIREAKAVSGGAPVVCTSTRTPDGLDSLRLWLTAGSTAALLGSSGAGKSSIVNALLGEEILETQPVREHDSRGRHTTTHRELFPLPGGAFLIDTPGMRELQLWAGEDSVEQTFDEIGDLTAQCRFSDCRHSTEPGCAVLAALASGSLDQNRWQSYNKLTSEVRRMDKKTLKRLHRAQKEIYKHSPKY